MTTVSLLSCGFRLVPMDSLNFGLKTHFYFNAKLEFVSMPTTICIGIFNDVYSYLCRIYIVLSTVSDLR